MPANVADLRQSYERAALTEGDLAASPIAQLQAWLDEALAVAPESGGYEPNAIALATSTPDGHPSVRYVLLKGLDEQGLAFYTNLESRKAEELIANPHAALAFWWPVLERQVRAEGRIERVSDADADAYFASRPRGSRLGAWASPQSQPLSDRATLEQRLEATESRFADEDAPIPRPPFWGGFRLVPQRVEFWQGRRSRLHDRLLYTRDGDGWQIERLAP